jgi:hypothetical protein
MSDESDWTIRDTTPPRIPRHPPNRYRRERKPSPISTAAMIGVLAYLGWHVVRCWIGS